MDTGHEGFGDIAHVHKTKRNMPRDSKEKPADVFKRIRQKVERVRLIAKAELEAEVVKAVKAAKPAGKAKNKKRAKRRAEAEATDTPSMSKPPMGRHANRRQNQPQGTHQSAKAGPSSGDAMQTSKEPTTVEKGVTMFQAYDAL